MEARMNSDTATTHRPAVATLRELAALENAYIELWYYALLFISNILNLPQELFLHTV